jgi:hypothetical protein
MMVGVYPVLNDPAKMDPFPAPSLGFAAIARQYLKLDGKVSLNLSFLSHVSSN